MSKPMSPNEVFDKGPTIPDFILDRVNELLCQRSGSNVITIRQDEVLSALPLDVSRQTAFDNCWLDFESVYRKAGWQVRYEQPSYDESFTPYWIFKP